MGLGVLVRGQFPSGIVGRLLPKDFRVTFEDG